MMQDDRHLLRDVSGAYERARRSYQQHVERGNTELADAALAKMQEIERDIDIRERSKSWRDRK